MKGVGFVSLNTDEIHPAGFIRPLKNKGITDEMYYHIYL